MRRLLGSLRTRPRRAAITAAAIVALVIVAKPWPEGDAAVAAKRGAPARLVFGIYPGGAAGTVRRPGRTRPEDASLRLRRLQELRGGTRPFVLHLYDAFTGRGDSAALPSTLDADIDAYLAAGFQVELVLAYRPATQDGDVAGFVEYVRERVRQLGPRPGVTGVQVTNEANVAGAPAAADGAYRGARAALVQGVVAAKDEARSGGFGQIGVGFNWAYQLGPAETEFWASLGRAGGRPFAEAVDWVGLDVYPGTWGPPLRGRLLARGARTATLDALRVLRTRFLPLAGLEAARLHVSEAGYPTGPGRSPRKQARVLHAVATAVAGARREYGVTDFRWFDLRDADSSSSSFESRYGLVRDDYAPKRAFRSFRRIIARHR